MPQQVDYSDIDKGIRESDREMESAGREERSARESYERMRHPFFIPRSQGEFFRAPSEYKDYADESHRRMQRAAEQGQSLRGWRGVGQRLDKIMADEPKRKTAKGRSSKGRSR